MNNYIEEDIPDDYYESDEWIKIEQANREYFEPEATKVTINRPKLTQDRNWNLLKQERLLAPLEDLQVAKIANCKFHVWLDTDRIMANYDIGYTSGKRVLDRKTYGTWSMQDPRKEIENRAVDALRTFVARSNIDFQVRFTRMYESEDVTNIVREINLIELCQDLPVKAWFIVEDHVYPARYEEKFGDRYTWCFNGKKKMHIDQFCDRVWNAI